MTRPTTHAERKALAVEKLTATVKDCFDLLPIEKAIDLNHACMLIVYALNESDTPADDR